MKHAYQRSFSAAAGVSSLYFPLCNEAGMMSAITPELKGDIKTGQNSFLMPPTSETDLSESTFGRHFWLMINGQTAWNVAGSSAQQRAQQFTDQADMVTVELGFLWHKVTRRNERLGIQAEVTNFVPATDDTVELMRVTLTNTSDQPMTLSPTAAIPIYGRSADNLRDHRHVTSLLHRIRTSEHGVIVQATLSFDERGHQVNHTSYAVLGAGPDGEAPVGFFPIMTDFTGDSGTLDWPDAIVRHRDPDETAGAALEGYEALGGLRFAEVTLAPQQSVSYFLTMGIGTDGDHAADAAYLSASEFERALKTTEAWWQDKLAGAAITTGQPEFDDWFSWVTIQPILRRIYGCSFLPHHDYGRGGRGWRDLWQDCLALLLMEPDGVQDMLLNNFAGVRIDGSNATIIGTEPGEFIADRNNIPRVWMDHGVWPLLTTKLYIDQTGDLGFLLQEQVYFRDQHTHRCQATDEFWDTAQGTLQKQINGETYKGTILEHLLLQHLTTFYNVGEHNHLRLEGADWNDGLDMAEERGESVAFSAMYGANLIALADLVNALKDRLNLDQVELLLEISRLFQDEKYNDVVDIKGRILNNYFDSCAGRVSGKKVGFDVDELSTLLRRQGLWILEHIRRTEWLETDAGNWFNGYYDNDGQRLEGANGSEVRMTLTGQTFAIMSSTATSEQIPQVVEAVNRHLWDDDLGGPRLNTNFKDVLLNMGRLFGFAYGHKENGAMFSHMSVMYAFGLYQQGYPEEGYRVLNSIFEHCHNFEKSKIFPGIPEYIDQRGRGMYPYLTGSASWYLYTVLTQMFGLRGELGGLVIEPKLMPEQFDENGEIRLTAMFRGQKVQVLYRLTDDGVVTEVVE